MKWMSLEVEVYWKTSDPGIVNCDGVTTKAKREDLRVGECIVYKDPSGLFPSIKVLEIGEEDLTIKVGEREVLVTLGGSKFLGESGRDYTNFYLEIRLLLTED